jgi:predicted transcriptional regulator
MYIGQCLIFYKIKVLLFSLRYFIKDIMAALKDNNKNKGSKGLVKPASHNLPNYYKVPEHQHFIDIAHKSQKITTAIYMVTDLITSGDPLVATLRSTSVDIMRKLFLMTSTPQIKRVHALSEVAGLMYGLGSYLQVIYHNGKISDMNYQLLLSELQNLQKRIDVLITKTMPYDRQKKSSQLVDEFTFTDSFFETGFDIQKDSINTKQYIKDSSLDVEDNEVKDTPLQKDIDKKIDNKEVEEVTKTKTISKGQSSSVKKASAPKKRSNKATSQKAIRHENILKILKQKRDAKIGDISSLIKDCGTKTIQRDLTELVKKGLVKREGDRRWSTYNLAY